MILISCKEHLIYYFIVISSSLDIFNKASKQWSLILVVLQYVNRVEYDWTSIVRIY